MLIKNIKEIIQNLIVIQNCIADKIDSIDQGKSYAHDLDQCLNQAWDKIDVVINSLESIKKI